MNIIKYCVDLTQPIQHPLTLLTVLVPLQCQNYPETTSLKVSRITYSFRLLLLLKSEIAGTNYLYIEKERNFKTYQEILIEPLLWSFGN